MADPGQLPPSIYQGLGWPQPDGSPVPMQPPGALGPPAEWGGLPPSVPQGLGWAPPPAAPSADDGAPPPVPPPAPAPTSLPSMGAPPPPAAQSSNASATPDYRVPMSAFGGGQSPVRTAAPGAPAAGSQPAANQPAAPQRPQTFDQRVNALEQREADTAAAQQQAIQAGVDAEKGLHADQAAAYRDYNKKIQDNATARRTDNEQWAKIYATNEAKLDATRKQIESWKFNRNAYMDSLGVGDKVSWGIGAVLAGIGNAMQGIKTGENPVIQMLQQNIHDANEQQMKERDNLVQRYGMDRQTGLDAQAYHATRQAEIDKQDGLALTALSKQLEEAAVKSADQMAQARGLDAAAKVKAQADELLKGSIQLRSQHQMQAEQNATARGHLALAQRQFDAEYGPKGFKQQDLDIRAADEMRKAAADAAKAHKEQSVNDPTTGRPLITAAGQQKLQMADSYEAAARQEKDPTHAAQLNQLAAAYRQAAYSSDAALAGDPKKAEAAQKKVNTAQDMSNNVEAVRGMLEAGPEAWNREQWAQLKVALQGVKVNYAQDMGERMSPKALEAIDDVTSIDPDSIWSRTADKGKALAALKVIQSQINQSANVALRGAGIQANWTPSTPGKAPAFGGQTADEIANDAKPSWFDTYVVNPIAHPIDTLQGNRTPEALQQQAFDEASRRTGTLSDGSPGRSSNYGLAPEQESTIDQLASRAAQAGHAEYGRILDDLSTPLLQISGHKARPSLAIGVASKLHDENPRLFADVLTRIAGAPGGGAMKAKEIADAVSSRGSIPVPGSDR